MVERISSETIYRGRVFEVRRDRVRIRGRSIVREVVVHPGAAAILPILSDGKILLIRQYRYPVDENLLEIPAGTLEEGENPEECALRELEEETGYKAGRLMLLTSFYMAPGYSSEYLRLYLAEDLERGVQRPEIDEEIELVEMGLEEALKAVREGLIKDSKTIIALLYYQLFVRG